MSLKSILKAYEKEPPLVTHLFFADDSVFFCRANKQESLSLKAILKAYDKDSGQLVNFQKYEISFCEKVKPHHKLTISGILEMRMDEKHDKYLGLPTVVGRCKKEICQSLRKGFA
ncbi:unnamed protein product [Linum trigynum]|uniref:Reverse transcriptase n=1 Tax=Linum trigynum TaxID=586398 RepID=A0AAV2ETC0_9ROSI